MKDIFYKLLIVSLIMFSCSLEPLVFADSPTESAKPYKLPPNIKKYLIDKYANIRDLSSSLIETPHGPKGYIHISGNLTPKNFDLILSAEADSQTRARAVATAFMADEAQFLGIKDLGELQERLIETITAYDGEHTLIKYSRIINGMLYDNAYVDITIGADNTIKFFSAELVPASPELYKAASNRTLTEEQIRNIIQQDIINSGKNVNEMKFEYISKWLQAAAPYVIYTSKVDFGTGNGKGKLNYVIDAFTGQILKKHKPYRKGVSSRMGRR